MCEECRCDIYVRDCETRGRILPLGHQAHILQSYKHSFQEGYYKGSLAGVCKAEDQILCLSDIGHVLIETEKRLVWDAFNRIPGMGRFVLESDGRIVGAGTILESK